MVVDLQGKRVLVMGLGLHGGGLGLTRWLVQQGAIVTVTDLKSASELRPSLEALAGLPVQFVLGQHREEDFRQADLVIRNPAVPRESPYLGIAREHGVPVEMEMGLFFRLCPAPIIGITGTKGKSTTTTLTGAMIRRRRPDAVVAGNLAGGNTGYASAQCALELLPHIRSHTPVVLELSSWQLEGLPPDLCPHIACVTNLYPDHLNRYRDLADYASAKKAIFLHQRANDAVVLNYDNRFTCAFATEAPSRVAWFSRRQRVEGAFLEGERLLWRWQGRTMAVATVQDVPLPGAHNLENVLAAIAVAMLWGADPEDVRQAIRDFVGMPHRLEFIAEIDGVRYYNDTTATTPDATLAALAAFNEAQGVILIAGGADKGLDFDGLGRAVVAQVKAVVLLEGTATDRLEAAVTAAGGRQRLAGRYGSLPEAVARAREIAVPGDVVLLSPGCASFGLFVNEFERGNLFRELVRRLRAESRHET